MAENAAIVLMEKDQETGFLSVMRGSYILQQGQNTVDKIYLTKENETKEKIHLFVTVPKEVEDWEYSAIFDEYHSDIFKELEIEVVEVEDTYNPTWELSFLYDVRHQVNEEKINKILSLHIKEVERVFEAIQDKKEEYTEE